MNISTSGKSKLRGRTHTCVLYDPKDGQIRHIHSVTTLGRMRAETDEEVEREAYALAKEGGRDVRAVRTLHLRDAELKPYVTYRVDVKSASLVEESTRFEGGPSSPARRAKRK